MYGAGLRAGAIAGHCRPLRAAAIAGHCRPLWAAAIEFQY